jgi:hypothetical protein
MVHLLPSCDVRHNYKSKRQIKQAIRRFWRYYDAVRKSAMLYCILRSTVFFARDSPELLKKFFLPVIDCFLQNCPYNLLFVNSDLSRSSLFSWLVLGQLKKQQKSYKSEWVSLSRKYRQMVNRQSTFHCRLFVQFLIPAFLYS